jgi:hypothetical protein
MIPCKDTGAMKTIAEAIIKNIRLVLFEPTTTRLHKKLTQEEQEIVVVINKNCVCLFIIKLI